MSHPQIGRARFGKSHSWSTLDVVGLFVYRTILHAGSSDKWGRL